MTPRKPPANATAPRPAVPLPLAPIRREIFDEAADLIAAGETRDVSLVLAKRFQLSQGTIARVMVLEALRYEREATALRHGVRNALQLARDAGAAVYEDSDQEARTA